MGGKELAGVEAAVSHEFIGANIKIIGIKFGVIYYWGENVSFGGNIDLSPPERNTNSLNLKNSEDITAYYGTNIHELKTTRLAAAPLTLMSAYKEAMVSVENADGQDALLLEIPYTGSGMPDASEIVLINPDNKEIQAVYDDGNGGGTGDIIGFRKSKNGEKYDLDSAEAKAIVDGFKDAWISQLTNKLNLFFNFGVTIRF